MGHSEMLLAVAGMTEDEIRERTDRIAAEDWSGFPASEQVAFRFARKLTAAPWDVTDLDVKELEAAFGRHRAVDIIWHVAWGNYMTRFADAFQIPLETTNVFEKPPEKPPEAPKQP
jgi:hypothetical protein